jgi:hypothetical protein
LAGGKFWLWRGIFFVLFFRKKGTKKIAAVETLAEFFGFEILAQGRQSFKCRTFSWDGRFLFL